MCTLETPVLLLKTTVIIEVIAYCFTESVSLRDIGKSTSRVEISSPSSSYLKAVCLRLLQTQTFSHPLLY